jgi:heme/copper-type cytochrome/quinol oxidase subunit 2
MKIPAKLAEPRHGLRVAQEDKGASHMEGASGYLWAISTVLMPILLALAIAYASYQTWEYRKNTRNRPKPMPKELHEPREPVQVEQQVRGIVIWSLISVVLLLAVILIFFW